MASYEGISRAYPGHNYEAPSYPNSTYQAPSYHTYEESKTQLVAEEHEEDVEDTTVDATAFTLAEIDLAKKSRDKVVTTHPPSLGYASITLIIVNRMIGTGIFRTPTTLAHGTHSVKLSLLIWGAGGVVAICGSHVFAEWALTVPRLRTPETGQKESVPRNGGEKNYLEYLMPVPKRFATCIYGIPFILFGTGAGNALLCAECLYRSFGVEPSGATVRGIAFVLAGFACLVHAGSRWGGIYLFNIFGTIKIFMMLTMVIIGVMYVTGSFGGSTEVAVDNFGSQDPIANSLGTAYGYAESLLAVLFAFGGFNQANYVMGEIGHPRKKFKRGTILTVLGVAILYVMVNLSYSLVVSDSDQLQSGTDTVAATFFLRVFGSKNANRVQNSFMAFSSFGNMLVQTFTASRVKQEIAKEGILPFTKFFAKNRTLMPRFWRRNKSSNKEESDDTPVGALLLHLIFTTILILATIPFSTGNSYRIYVNLYSFVIDAFFGFCVGLGILVMRLRRKSRWSTKSKSNVYLSILTATIFTLANCFPLVAVWIQPPKGTDSSLPVVWWTTGAIGAGAIGLAILYWLTLQFVMPKLKGGPLQVERKFFFKDDHGYRVIWHEITSVNWKTKTSQLASHRHQFEMNDHHFESRQFTNHQYENRQFENRQFEHHQFEMNSSPRGPPERQSMNSSIVQHTPTDEQALLNERMQ